MADYADIDGGGAPFGTPEKDPGLVSVLLNWCGALLSVALLAGLGFWVYQLAMRDVSGVPVVQALEGPMRVQPEDPGGSQAAHQGLAVNSVAAEGTAEAPAERLVLAPAPGELTDEDLPKPQLEATATPVVQPAPRPSRDELQAMADELAEGVTPLAANLADRVPESTPGVARSPVPRPRPVGDLTAEAVANSVALTAARVAVATAASDVPAGTRLVQFGAYDTTEAANAAWDTLSTRFTDFLVGKSQVVQEAVSGGKTFYRLRAMGFADLSDARRFCSALVAERQACIPVVVR